MQSILEHHIHIGIEIITYGEMQLDFKSINKLWKLTCVAVKEIMTFVNWDKAMHLISRLNLCECAWRNSIRNKYNSSQMSRHGLTLLPIVTLELCMRRLNAWHIVMQNMGIDTIILVKESTWDIFGKWKSKLDLDLPR